MIRKNGIGRLYSGPLIRPSLERREGFVSYERTSHPSNIIKNSTPYTFVAQITSSRLIWGVLELISMWNQLKTTNLWTSVYYTRAFNGECLREYAIIIPSLLPELHLLESSQLRGSRRLSFIRLHKFIAHFPRPCPCTNPIHVLLLSRPLSLMISVSWGMWNWTLESGDGNGSR